MVLTQQDGTEPGKEPAATIEPRQTPPCRDEGILRQFIRGHVIADQAPGLAAKTGLQGTTQFPKRIAIPMTRQSQEIPYIGTVLGGCYRMGDVFAHRRRPLATRCGFESGFHQPGTDYGASTARPGCVPETRNGGPSCSTRIRTSRGSPLKALDS